MDLFRVSTVSAAVDRKLAIIRETCTAFHGKAAGGSTELQEIAFVLLIAVEIVPPLVRYWNQ